MVRRPERPPDMAAATRTSGRRKVQQESIAGKATGTFYSDSQPFALVIHAGDRATVWGTYANHAEADAIGRRLRVHGFDARVQQVTP